MADDDNIDIPEYRDELGAGQYLLQRRIGTLNKARLHIRDDISDRILNYPEAPRLTTLFTLGYISSDVVLRDMAKLALEGKSDLTSSEFFAVIKHNHELRTSYEEHLFPIRVENRGVRDVLDKHLKVGYYTIVDNIQTPILISKRKQAGNIVYKVHYRDLTYRPTLLEMDLDNWLEDSYGDFILYFGQYSEQLKRDILGLIKGNLFGSYHPRIQKRLVDFSKQEYSPVRKVNKKRVSLKKKSPKKKSPKVSRKRKSPKRKPKISRKKKSPKK